MADDADKLSQQSAAAACSHSELLAGLVAGFLHFDCCTRSDIHIGNQVDTHIGMDCNKPDMGEVVGMVPYMERDSMGMSKVVGMAEDNVGKD